MHFNIHSKIQIMYFELYIVKYKIKNTFYNINYEIQNLYSII